MTLRRRDLYFIVISTAIIVFLMGRTFYVHIYISSCNGARIIQHITTKKVTVYCEMSVFIKIPTTLGCWASFLTRRPRYSKPIFTLLILFWFTTEFSDISHFVYKLPFFSIFNWTVNSHWRKRIIIKKIYGPIHWFFYFLLFKIQTFENAKKVFYKLVNKTVPLILLIWIMNVQWLHQPMIWNDI